VAFSQSDTADFGADIPISIDDLRSDSRSKALSINSKSAKMKQ
jgi:hypothetical protein